MGIQIEGCVEERKQVFSETPAVTQDLQQHDLILIKSAHLGDFLTCSTATCYAFR